MALKDVALSSGRFVASSEFETSEFLYVSLRNSISPLIKRQQTTKDIEVTVQTALRLWLMESSNFCLFDHYFCSWSKISTHAMFTIYWELSWVVTIRCHLICLIPVRMIVIVIMWILYCSACTSASLEPSYVLRAIGADEDLAHSSIRSDRRLLIDPSQKMGHQHGVYQLIVIAMT